MRRLRIGMLCHSTNPRGGVAHALAVAEALTTRGHEVVVHAPDPSGSGFPRPARCGLVSVTARPLPAGAGLAALVAQRIEDYHRHFAVQAAGAWDILHAHDGIGANALIRLREQRRINAFVRTVHHLDDFSDPQVCAWQTASVAGADAVACVSRHWQEALRSGFGVEAPVVGNGVDLTRFAPEPGPEDETVRKLYALDRMRPVVLSVGGIEARKNSVRLLEAFLRLRRHHPQARLLVVGGASLLDHSPTRAEFFAILGRAGLAASADGPVTLTGPIPDRHMAPLFRAADVFAFPSLREGFGLVVLEALACGTPVVVSRSAPFTEYLTDAEVRFAPPESVPGICTALEAALDPWNRACLRPSGFALVRRMGWDRCAERHEFVYERLLARHSTPRPVFDPPAVAPRLPGELHA